MAGSNEATINRWTFANQSPSAAKEEVITSYVPSDAKLWRVGVWYGGPEDRPESGHEANILEIEEGDE